ncbi:glycosyltransferase family 2 protein [candidate division KSB1 bacterium]|nr:glycosyltransferase family 2 protein [candidate division KSB1 bacterium]
MNQVIFSIIIVNWNTKRHLRNCISSIIKKNLNTNYEIIVVDNSSTDDSVSMLKSEYAADVILIENKENVGFARANNTAIKASQGEVILLLNSDTEIVTNDFLESAEKFLLTNNEVGILGVKLTLPDGSQQASGGKFISIWELFKTQVLLLDSPMYYKMINAFPKRRDIDFYEVDYVCGACLFVRREVINDIGYLNERFFMYGEDMEFCYRAQIKNWKVGVFNNIEVLHLRGQSTKKNPENSYLIGIKNNCSLIKEFHGSFSLILAHLIYTYGLFIRFLLSFFRNDISPASYLKMIRMLYK